MYGRAEFIEKTLSFMAHTMLGEQPKLGYELLLTCLNEKN